MLHWTLKGTFLQNTVMIFSSQKQVICSVVVAGGSRRAGPPLWRLSGGAKIDSRCDLGKLSVISIYVGHRLDTLTQPLQFMSIRVPSAMQAMILSGRPYPCNEPKGCPQPGSDSRETSLPSCETIERPQIDCKTKGRPRVQVGSLGERPQPDCER